MTTRRGLGCRVQVPAFTLIEMIGALAVVTILASLMVPVVIRQIDRAAWNQEVINMGAISNGIVLQVLRNKSNSIPVAWPTAIAQWLNLPAYSIATNARGYSRAFLVDGAGWLGTNVPFAQSAAGAWVTNTARAVVISTIGGAPLPLPSGVVSGSAFNDVWNTPDRAKPIDSSGSIWSSWNGRGDDLVVQRINLQPLFHRVILYNRSGANVYFDIDGSSRVAISHQWDAYYLTGSLLDLYAADSSTLLSTELINRDMSRVFDASGWIDDIGTGPASVTTSNFQDIAYGFLTSFPTDSTRGVAESLTAYMNAYASWASSCFAGANVEAVPEYQIVRGTYECFRQPVNPGHDLSNTQPGPCELLH